MGKDRLSQAQAALDAAVRPGLWEHGGDAQIVRIGEDGDLTVKLRGQCAGCPSATLVTRPEMERALRPHLPWLSRVELAAPVSEELLETARQMLRRP